MPRRRRDDPDQMTLFTFTRTERAGVDAQGNALWRVVPTGAPTAWVTPSQLARALSVHVVTIYGWIDRGIIPHDRWQRRGPKLLFIHADEVERLLDTGDK